MALMSSLWAIRKSVQSSAHRESGAALLSAVTFGFLFLAWMLAFITLNASLAVVRASKDLRVNPYLRASTVLSSRAFALGLAAELANRDLRSRCPQVGNLYRCISNGVSQGTFGAISPLSNFACTSGNDKLLGELERDITSCIRNFSLEWDGSSGSLSVETATGRNGAFLHQTDRLQLQRQNTNTPTLLVAWPGSNSCSGDRQAITSTPQSTVEGNLLTFCGPPAFGCTNLSNSQNQWVQTPNPGGQQGIRLDSGCMSNRATPPTAAAGSALPIAFAANNLREILQTFCSHTDAGYSCPNHPIISLNSSPAPITINSDAIIAGGGSITLITCRAIEHSSRAMLGSEGLTQGALLLVLMEYDAATRTYSLCNPSGTLTLRANRLENGLSVIAPGQSIEILNGNGGIMSGLLIGRTLALRGITFSPTALQTNATSDTRTAISRLFPTLLDSLQVEDIRATGLSNGI